MVGQPNTDPGVEIVVLPGSDRYDVSDERWSDQVAALYDQLRRDGGSLRTKETSIPGQKGAASEVILALGSSGALTAAVAIFRAWLARDQSRSLTLSWSDGEKHSSVCVQAEDLDEDAFEEIARAAALQFSGG
jgi:hypothetical protein